MLESNWSWLWYHDQQRQVIRLYLWTLFIVVDNKYVDDIEECATAEEVRETLNENI